MCVGGGSYKSVAMTLAMLVALTVPLPSTTPIVTKVCLFPPSFNGYYRKMSYFQTFPQSLALNF